MKSVVKQIKGPFQVQNSNGDTFRIMGATLAEAWDTMLDWIVEATEECWTSRF